MKKKTTALFSVAFFVAVAWVAVVSTVGHADVVCRAPRINGFDDCYDRAKSKVGATTSDLSRMKIYVTVSLGHIYAQSNFLTPGADYPTKLAVSGDIDALNLVNNLVGEGVVSEDRLREAVRNEVTFFVDKQALDRSPLSVDFEGSKRVYTVEGRLLADVDRADEDRLAAVRRAREVEARRRQEQEEANRLAEERAERIRREKEEADRQARVVAERKKREKEEKFVAFARRDAALEDSMFSLHRARKAELAKNSTPDMYLFSVVRHGGGVEIMTKQGSVFVYNNEIELLKKGTPLGPDHGLTKLLKTRGEGAFVLYTNGEEQIGWADDLTFAIQKSYHQERIFRDPFSEKTSVMTQRMNSFQVSSPRDVVTLIAGDSFEVTDWKIIQNIAPTLKQKSFDDVRVIDKSGVPRWDGGDGKAVIVITGHIDAKLASFIQDLGEAGYFRDNAVLLNTCRMPATRELAARICSEHGAIGVFCYDSKIEAADVEDFVLDTADRIKSNPSKKFVDLINEALGKHGLNGVWTVCELFRLTGRDRLVLTDAGRKRRR